MLLTFESQRPTLTTTNGMFESGERFTGVPRLEFSDEGCVAASDEQGKIYSDNIVPIISFMLRTVRIHTWGPYKCPSTLVNFTAR